MKKPPLTTPEPNASSLWERLEEFARAHVQRFIQTLLEEEVTELLGRRSQRGGMRLIQPQGIAMAMANLDA